MMDYPTLDAHAHVARPAAPDALAGTGAVLAMTLALDEAALAVGHDEALMTWGAGCHPRFPGAQHAFDAGRFADLLERTAVAGEVGLDGSSRVPLAVQQTVFAQVLEVVAARPRLLSIHSYAATGPVLAALRRTPVVAPILHWWTGSAAETAEAVALGCYFSIHSQVARRSVFRVHVPPERVLVESDHGYRDPPAAIRPRIEWVEYLVAQQYRLAVTDLRALVWRNFATLVRRTGTAALLRPALAALLPDEGSGIADQGSGRASPVPER